MTRLSNQEWITYINSYLDRIVRTHAEAERRVATVMNAYEALFEALESDEGEPARPVRRAYERAYEDAQSFLDAQDSHITSFIRAVDEFDGRESPDPGLTSFRDHAAQLFSSYVDANGHLEDTLQAMNQDVCEAFH